MLSCVWLCNPVDCSPRGSSVHGDSPCKNTEVSCHALLQEIFPTQGSNPGVPHCRQILYWLSHQGSPSLQIEVVSELQFSSYSLYIQGSLFLLRHPKHTHTNFIPQRLKTISKARTFTVQICLSHPSKLQSRQGKEKIIYIWMQGPLPKPGWELKGWKTPLAK